MEESIADPDERRFVEPRLAHLLGLEAAALISRPTKRLRTCGAFHIRTTTMPGHTLLRFTTESVNIGTGPLELRGSRPDTSIPTMLVVQRIYDDSGGFRDIPCALVHVLGR